jgi:extracellular elastinolytic metalloproteinase
VEGHDLEPDRDFRTGSVQPTAAQRRAVSNLGATARWNRFGTPQSLIRYGRFLATNVQGSNAQEAARNFLANNARVFGLSDDYLSDADSLRFVNDAEMEDSNGHAVFFRQQFGVLPAIKDGSVIVGLTGSQNAGWDVSYVSSSLTRDTGLAQTGTSLAPSAAWLAAADALGEGFDAADVTGTREDRLKSGGLRSDFTLLTVTGLAQEQRVRLTAIPTPTDGVIPAYEAIFLNDQGGEAEAFTSFVDANTGDVLFRANNVQQLMQAEEPAPTTEAFTGTYEANTCGQNGPFSVAAGTQTVAVAVDATNPANDIVLQLVYNGEVVAEADTLTTPETITYRPEGGVPAGDYTVKVCSFENAQPLPPNSYTGFFATSAADTPSEALPYPPEWEYFFANPPIGPDNASYPSDDTRQVACWNTLSYGDAPPAGCDLDAANQASRGPWDTNPHANSLPTFTTAGNNARSAESWFSPLTPGPTGYRPVSEDRKYSTNTTSGTNYEWTNVWYTSDCSPANFTPGVGNDVSAATAALFASHNRMHDWSYNLGFTEQAYNLQDSNFGTTPPDRENDPELGDVQAGAASGGAPTYLGRDNANQITLNDGIAPITNMYLWQPIAAAFYPPCVDGDYDMSVIAHEYGHAIQNRMVAGPDEGLSGLQARSMGESWSDLTAIEYLYEYGYEPEGGANRYAVGPYVTGNKQTGIRNYAMNDSPLNYSDIEYDPNGVTSPHADGEIWSATNFEMRKLLMDKYDGSFPSGPGTALQQECADGERPANLCPGNRRWAQIFHDAFLLMESSVSFLDARDAYLAADQMRLNGANQRQLWLAFAHRGMGPGASSKGSDDRDPVPHFASPSENNATITFRPETASGAEVQRFKVYVGKYEARAVPIADNIRSTDRTETARFAPGAYEFVVQAPGYGLRRYEQTFQPGQDATVRIPMRANWASLAEGASASGDASSGEGGSSASQLIDETEETNWRADGPPIEGKQVTVNLVGGSHLVDRVNVSAFLRPQEQGNKFGDTDTQSRFSALREFEILTCNAANNNCLTDAGFRTVYTNPAVTDTGTSSADVPRPLAPNLAFQSYDVTDTNATHVRLRVISNQCTGGPAYQGDQDADPSNNSDCPTGSEEDDVVRAAELEVFSR